MVGLVFVLKVLVQELEMFGLGVVVVLGVLVIVVAGAVSWRGAFHWRPAKVEGRHRGGVRVPLGLWWAMAAGTGSLSSKHRVSLYWSVKYEGSAWGLVAVAVSWSSRGRSWIGGNEYTIGVELVDQSTGHWSEVGLYDGGFGGGCLLNCQAARLGVFSTWR